MLRLLICAGGTGGGVYPALAVLEALRNKFRTDHDASTLDVPDDYRPKESSHPQPLSVLWVGGQGGMEADLVRRAGVDYQAIPAAGLHGVGLRSTPRNAWRIARGFQSSRCILSSFQPQVAFFTGGYVAVPMALASRYTAGYRPRPRSLLYVPDVEPGLALKILARFADRLAVSVKASEPYFPARRLDLVATGYPLRPQLTRWANMANRREAGLKVFDLSPEYPTLLVYGGSKGAQSINRALIAILPELLTSMQVIHLSGQAGWPEVQANFQAHIASLPGNLPKRYRCFAYLHEDMGAAFSAASLALTRAGASTLGELTSFGLPAILVPYPYAWRYQVVNASYLAERGAAVIMEDNRLDTELLSGLRSLAGDQSKLAQMRAALQNLSQPAAAEKLAGLILELGRPAGGAL